jgi:CRP-like cAMP-binding protein
MATTTLEAHEVFRFLRPDQVRTLSETAEEVSVAAGALVYQKGQAARHLYVIIEGQAALRLPVRKGVSVLVDQLGAGAMFGSCVCMDLATYTLSAQCTEDSRLLKIDAMLLKKLMDDDLRMGYAIQTQISKIYFQRYLDAMHKLQAIVMNLAVESEPNAA